MFDYNIVINKINGEKIIFKEKDELEKHFEILFKDVYDNSDSYEDNERDSAHEIMSFMEKKKFNEENFIELINNEKNNLGYFLYDCDTMEVGEVIINLKV